MLFASPPVFAVALPKYKASRIQRPERVVRGKVPAQHGHEIIRASRPIRQANRRRVAGAVDRSQAARRTLPSPSKKTCRSAKRKSSRQLWKTSCSSPCRRLRLPISDWRVRMPIMLTANMTGTNDHIDWLVSVGLSIIHFLKEHCPQAADERCLRRWMRRARSALLQRRRCYAATRRAEVRPGGARAREGSW